jgi:hypothetical protein
VQRSAYPGPVAERSNEATVAASSRSHANTGEENIQMRPPENERESLLDDEDRALLDNPNVPDDVKSEVSERLERWHDEELEDELEDEPLP